MLGDQGDERKILSGSDAGAQASLLAAARLIRERLPLDAVGRLLQSSDPLVAEAAEYWLEAEDSTPARQLVLARHPGEAIILGAREEFDPGHDTYPAFDKLEQQLRDELLKPGGPTEIYALLSSGYWGDAGQIIIYIGADNTRVAYSKGKTQSSSRTLAAEELQKLRGFIAENRVEELGPLATTVNDGMQYEYVHVSSHGGRRVFMNNPGVYVTAGSTYDLLCDVFFGLRPDTKP